MTRYGAALALATFVGATGAAGLQGGSETVLLVEDQESLRKIVPEVLEAIGYTVIEARHAGHALEIAERHPAPIHVLMTDVVMPGMSGSDLAQELTASHAATGTEGPGLGIAPSA